MKDPESTLAKTQKKLYTDGKYTTAHPPPPQQYRELQKLLCLHNYSLSCHVFHA